MATSVTPIDKGTIFSRRPRRNITAGEKRLVEIAQTARACSMLILAEAQRRGLIRSLDNGDWDLSTGFKELPKFLQLERQALQGLGLERRQKIKSLEDLLAEPEEA